ncbi:MAG: sulfatase-like hydrolase/transferase [Bacteroidota bacterium]
MRPLSLLVFLTFFLYSCSEKESTPLPPPNILWISAEDISPAWGCYGDKQATTPNIDALAKRGYVFTNAFSNAPICAPARATLITGIYATSTGTQNLRSDIPIPRNLKILPEILSAQGYFTSNNAKTDYNFSPQGRWDDLGREAHWQNRKQGQPFFSIFNYTITHEGHANRFDTQDTESLKTTHDPKDMVVPPYFPDTGEIRKILAHQYDLITVFDQKLGALLAQLKEEGLYDNTIIFIFSDHGFGLPRYKRWLYHTGLQVPFVLHVPEKYRYLTTPLKSGKVKNKVGFVDFAPTVLHLAGAQIPEIMEGHVFLGPHAQEKDYIFGYRDRADDVFDVSRSVFNGRYLYIRNYLPHRPYIQNALIFNKDKTSYNELFRLKALGQLPKESLKMFRPKMPEELYDVQKDPDQLENLAQNEAHDTLKRHLSQVLRSHLLRTRDTGFMAEGQMMLWGKNSSVYEIAKDTANYDMIQVLNAAEMVGAINNLEGLEGSLSHEDPSIRFWALNAIDAFEGDIGSRRNYLIAALNDPSLPNRGLAAEILIKRLDAPKVAYNALEHILQTDQDETVLLHIAVNVRNLGPKAAPLVPTIKAEVYPKIEGEVWGRYKNWSYPMFIGMALDQTLVNCGEIIE